MCPTNIELYFILFIKILSLPSRKYNLQRSTRLQLAQDIGRYLYLFLLSNIKHIKLIFLNQFSNENMERNNTKLLVNNLYLFFFSCIVLLVFCKNYVGFVKLSKILILLFNFNSLKNCKIQ